MGRSVATMTISLSKQMAKNLKSWSAKEGVTTSELVRNAIRHYQQAQQLGAKKISWEAIEKKLRHVSHSGRKVSLTDFVIRDRSTH